MSKRVSWDKNIPENTQTEKCGICKHRNIRPYKREMFICRICKKNLCINCLLITNGKEYCIKHYTFPVFFNIQKRYKKYFEIINNAIRNI